jgi:molybdopterin-guanine dinucleotide biosynthesis protein A
MGTDKTSLDWHGRTLLEHMIRLLSAVAENVHVAGKGDLLDEQPGYGPIGGILTALRYSSTQNNLIVAVDLPLLTVDFLKYFKERQNRSQSSLLVCKIGSVFPLCLGIQRSLLTALDSYVADGGKSIHGFIQAAAADIIGSTELAGAGFSSDIFFNINTEIDYRRALTAYKP